jgi:predicted nucleic acid-binding protein
MPDEVMVMDSGPLILLAKIDALSILPQLPLHYLVSPIVLKELTDGPSFGHPAIDVPWLRMAAPLEPVPAYIRATLDDGEAEAIHLALERNIRFICLDDRRGRRMAKALGLEVVGLLGLLTLAKRQGVISALRPYIDHLLEIGARYSPDLVQAVLTNASE